MIGKGNVLISDCISNAFCSEYKLKFVELILALCKKIHRTEQALSLQKNFIRFISRTRNRKELIFHIRESDI